MEVLDRNVNINALASWTPSRVITQSGQNRWKDRSRGSMRTGRDLGGAATYLCRFHTEMKISAPLPIGYPAGSPFSGAGSTSAASDLLIRMGGCGYIRRDSARAALTYGSFLRSSRSAYTLVNIRNLFAPQPRSCMHTDQMGWPRVCLRRLRQGCPHIQQHLEILHICMRSQQSNTS